MCTCVSSMQQPLHRCVCVCVCVCVLCLTPLVSECRLGVSIAGRPSAVTGPVELLTQGTWGGSLPLGNVVHVGGKREVIHEHSNLRHDVESAFQLPVLLLPWSNEVRAKKGSQVGQRHLVFL